MRTTRSARPGVGRAGVSIAATGAVLALLVVAGATAPASAATEVDFTDFPGTFAVEHLTDSPHENAESAVDDQIDSKYFNFYSTGWLRYTLQTAAVVTKYSITSANDIPARDPKNWVLEGSNNGGTSWTTLNTKTGVTFSSRFQTQTFSFSNSTAYKTYQLRITANNGDGFSQLSEWRLLGQSNSAAPVATPAGLTATAVNADQVQLKWTRVSRTGTYRLERSLNGTTWTQVKVPAGTVQRAFDDSLTGNTAYRYRLRTENSTGVSAWATANATTPAASVPSSLNDPLVGGNGPHGTVSQVNADSGVAFYASPATGTAGSWSYPMFRQAWAYTKQTYGDFGSPLLSVVQHPVDVDVATPYTRRASEFGYRTVLDVPANWQLNGDYYAKDASIHELGHIVANYNAGIAGSAPASELWGDCAWCDLFQFDVYTAIGDTAAADRVKAQWLATTADTPRANTYWFRDWFYPIWSNYGHSAVMAKYIKSVSAQYPSHDAEHIRQMNLGEFVHFWSGAAAVDLKAQATTAFGWTSTTQAQWLKAKQDFPAITY